MNSLDRILSRFQMPDYPDGCWIWTGATTQNGYGRVGFRGESHYVYRLTYEVFRGPIPDGSYMDHACRTPSCGNPWHVTPVSPAVNVATAVGHISERRAAQTHCKRGHEFTPENTYTPKARRADGGPRRMCRTCQIDRQRERRARERGQA